VTDSWSDDAAELDEKKVLLGFLATQQAALRRKLDGLSEEDARRSPVGSGTNLAGLLKHATYVHARWFELCFADAVPDGRLPWPTEDHRAAPDETLDVLRERFDTTLVIARGIVDGAGLEELNRGWQGGGFQPETFTLRWIILHMIEELARHCGHADIIREQIDGATGYP
jgi:uncharacterized damage-inducible protein DinB